MSLSPEEMDTTLDILNALYQMLDLVGIEYDHITGANVVEYMDNLAEHAEGVAVQAEREAAHRS